MINTKKPAKMADIARALDVSTVAVSKALSGQKGVSEELRERIKRTAQEMGYKRPSAKTRARADAGFNIGALIPMRYLDSTETFYWKLYREVTSRAMQRECFVMLELISDDDALNKRLPKLVTENKADGYIIIGKPLHGFAGYIKQMCRKPCVYLDFYDSDVSADSVLSNGFYGTYALTNYLFEKGHTDIGFVGTLLATDSITDRYLGFEKSMLEHGRKARPECVISDRDTQSGATSDMRLPAKLPTAFVCNCDYMASVLIRRLREQGVKVPDDVSVVGFDNYINPALCDIGITTYAVDIGEMARCAVLALSKQMLGDPYRPGMQITDGYIVEKQSVKNI